MSGRRFKTAIITVMIYEILISLFNPYGVSLFKTVITLLLWISLFQSLRIFISRHDEIRDSIPKPAYIVYILILLWNIVSIIRSGLDIENTVTTLLGNPATSLALLVPFSFCFFLDSTNLRIVGKFFLYIILAALPVYLFFAKFSGIADDISYNLAFQALVSGTIFLIILIPFQSARIVILIIIGSILLFYIATMTGSRTMMLRILLIFMSVFAVLLYRKFHIQTIIYVALIILCLPFYLLFQSIRLGESPFEKYLKYTKSPELSVDTRTFLYLEVFSDLKDNNALLAGKGSVARYYSPYFTQEAGDASIRLSVEVGILAKLLSGGFISVILNLTLLLISIFLALFKSNNHFIISIGFLLVIHTILLFVENFQLYSLYNLLIWFLIGVCLSREMRGLNDNEILKIISLR